MDPIWLAYLSDVTAATPRFHAPAEAETPYHIAYRRLMMDAEGEVADRELISITVHRPGGSVVSDGMERSRSKRTVSMETALGGVAEPAESELPFLRCVPQITVESEEVAEIPCTGLHASGGVI